MSAPLSPRRAPPFVVVVAVIFSGRTTGFGPRCVVLRVIAAFVTPILTVITVLVFSHSATSRAGGFPHLCEL